MTPREMLEVLTAKAARNEWDGFDIMEVAPADILKISKWVRELEALAETSQHWHAEASRLTVRADRLQSEVAKLREALVQVLESEARWPLATPTEAIARAALVEEKP